MLLGIADPFPAFCVDRAVWTFAMTVESEQELAVTRLPKNAKATTQQAARQRVLDRFLGIDQTKAKGRFRAPSG